MCYFSLIETESDIIIEDVLDNAIVARWRKGKQFYAFDIDFDRKMETFIFDFVETNKYVEAQSKYDCYRDCVNYFNYLKYVEVPKNII